MNRLRNRLIFVFLAATLIPLGVTWWLAASLLEHSLRLASTKDLDETSRLLEQTGREFYQQAREALKGDARSGRLAPERFAADARERWPEPVASFWASGEPERFVLSVPRGDSLQYLVRQESEVRRYERPLGTVEMSRITEQYARARALVEQARSRDLRRGFIFTFVILAAAIWLASLAVLVYSAHRISRPIHQLTAALAEVAAGNLSVRVPIQRDDEVGKAIQAFNRMAGQLERSHERLLYLTRLESWQTLARKMAHEVKNSLTPIRLTVEEIAARHPAGDGAFLRQAAQIVVDEVNALERRVRAFSELAAEPPVKPRAFDAAALLEERICFLKTAHPEITYLVRPQKELPKVRADEDLIRGVLTNLLENAAAAAGTGGTVLGVTRLGDGMVEVEVQDSGGGLSPEARSSLFEPTISFKKGGMGLGLSIARRSALLCGGDIVLVEGELGGAAFRVLLPLACEPNGSSS